MKTNDNETDGDRDALAIGVWENEGGSLGRDDMNHQYGRRVERDRSWTIYHVFTGVPAEMAGQPMIGLDEADATAAMICLNTRNVRRRNAARVRQAFAIPIGLL